MVIEGNVGRGRGHGRERERGWWNEYISRREGWVSVWEGCKVWLGRKVGKSVAMNFLPTKIMGVGGQERETGEEARASEGGSAVLKSSAQGDSEGCAE